MSRSANFDEDELPDPPSEAYSDEFSREVDDEWLRAAEQVDQIAAIVQWFHARFWDPANETPYMSSEGGYIWVHGGPYDALEQIEERFAGIATEEAIEAAVDSVQNTGIFDWAPTQLTYYDEDQGVFVDTRNAPTQRLDGRLEKLLAVLSLAGDENVKETAKNLTYAGVITALETFLWETMAYWVENDDKTVMSLITELPVFRDREMKLGDIYVMSGKLKAEVKAHLQHLVWHSWKQVAPLLKFGLDIDLPSFRPFIEPTKKRHDVVHRSGLDVDGAEVEITEQEVRDLAKVVSEFANDLDEKIARGRSEFSGSPL